METPCFDEEKGHALVESPLMCNRCFTLSDSVRALSTKLCPSLHCEDDLVEKTVPQVVPKRPVPPVPKFEAKQVQENIQAAEKEMRRLKLLQMVHWERQRLAELVAKKNKGGFLAIVHDNLFICTDMYIFLKFNMLSEVSTTSILCPCVMRKSSAWPGSRHLIHRKSIALRI